MNKMTFRTLAGMSIAVAAAAATQSCQTQKDTDNRPVLAVSIEPQSALLEQLAGDRFRIVTVVPQGDNPETFEPSPRIRQAVEDAEVYFTTGQLVFETNLQMSSNDDVEFVNTSADITPVYGTHSHCKSHTNFLPDHHDQEGLESDPHVWVSVRNARKISETMARKLIEMDPEHAADYRSRAEMLDAHLDSLDHAFADRLSRAGNPSFLVWHPSLSYFARDYGLNQVAVSQESKEASVGQIRAAVDHAVSDSVKVFFFQQDLDSRQAAAVSAGAGTRQVNINVLGHDWEAELQKVVDELTAD